MKIGLARIGAAVVATGALVGSGLFAQEGAGAGPESKLERVVLYKHGLGYFERTASVRGDAEIKLNFKHDQMKDILKSFYAVDLDGGRIANISYDSAAPLEKQMEEILVRVPAEQSLTGLLSRLQGARVRLILPGETLEGQVLGLEEEKRQVEGGTVLTVRFLALATADGSFRTVPLADVAGFSILDEALQADVKRYLELTLQGKYKDRKAVKIYATGGGERSVLMGYLLETPVWKTSYRLLVQPEGAPILQGWAMIENPTDEDWDKVDVSLVAGNPISFVMDLYQPYYPTRSVVPLEVLFPGVDVRAGVAIPQDKAGDADDEAPGAEMSRARKSMRDAAEAEEYADRAGGGAGGGRELRRAAERGLESLAEIESAAKGASLGEMFEYSIDEPVSVPRGQSALVPVLSSKIDAERLLYFQERIAANPLNAFLLTNSTGLTLDNGPVTVFQGSASLGEGLLHQTLQPGMRAILTYAVETGVDVEKTVAQNQRPIHKMTLADGVLTYRMHRVQETKYHVNNKTERAAQLLLDHFRAQGYALVKPEKPEDEQPGTYRFRVALEPKKTLDFTVEEKIEVSQAVYVDRNQVGQLRLFVEQPAASEEMRKFLASILSTMEEIAKVEADWNGANTRRTTLEADQARYRENMTRLGDTPRERELRAQYVERLAGSEEDIGKIRIEMDDLAEKKRTLEADLAKEIRSARFD
ncbi:MAG: DUF4139 domain-containing protein [Planctomycetes bacterium]|nr:DUF4139 domain-containing protein [Planctomycetota bacterium]